LKKSYRVKSEKDFNAIFKKGQSVANRKFVIYKLEKEQKHFRVGISVSKKLGNAVMRNKIKRRIRHVLLTHQVELAALDFVVISRKGVEILTYQELEQNLLHVLKIAKIYGAGFIHLFLWHFWKPFFSIIMMSVIKLMNRAILAEAALSYLGLGDPLSKSWGMIITRAMDFPNIYLTEFWKWWLVYPVIFMVLMVLSIAIIGQKIERKIGGVYRIQ